MRRFRLFFRGGVSRQGVLHFCLTIREERRGVLHFHPFVEHTLERDEVESSLSSAPSSTLGSTSLSCTPSSSPTGTEVRDLNTFTLRKAGGDFVERASPFFVENGVSRMRVGKCSSSAGTSSGKVHDRERAVQVGPPR